MIIAKRLKGKAIAAWLGPTGEAARRAARGIRQQWKNEPQRLEVYIDPADPWSYLAAQAASRLVEAYPVELAVHIVTPPASDVDPQPGMRAKHAVRDAQLLAEYWDVEFPGKKEADPGALREVNSSLIKERPAAEQLRAALELTTAMWSNDRKALTKLLGTWGTESTGAVAPILSSNYGALRKAGHYQGGMLAYGGEWYWGIDRLHHLEAALARAVGSDVAHVVSPRPATDRGAVSLSEKPLACEMWFSFRSPYSYLALEQIEGVLAPYRVPLVLRPVMPMVNRGLAMPTVKRMYIAYDAKREADRLGIRFGELCEVTGAGAIENLMTLAQWADQRGALLPFAKSALRGTWAEARDMSEYVDLRHVVERAGLPWQEARDALGSSLRTESQKWAQGNAADLAVIGLWGVPSLRCGEFVAWGQDRLPLLGDRLRRHELAAATKNPS
jgi:2-hydroxychromene-2-carboxylate isomerase